MNYAKELYDLMNKILPDYNGKICVPLSSGLDSRVIAALLAKRRNIDLAFTQFELKYPIKINKNIKNVRHTRQIATALNIKQFYAINVNHDTDEDRKAIRGLPDEHILLKSKMYTGLRKLNEFIDTSNFTFILGHGLDAITGIYATPFANIKSKDLITEEKKKKYYGGIFAGTYGKFGSWDCPFWPSELEDFYRSIPKKHRFMQNLYREMIRIYLPGVASIPRENMRCGVDVNNIIYYLARTEYSIRKLKP